MDFGGPLVHCRWKFGFGSLAFVLKWRPFLFIPMLIRTGSLFYTSVWLLNKFVFWKRLDFYSRFSFRLRHFSDAFPKKWISSWIEFDLVTDWQFRPPFATNWPIICQGFSAVDFQWISTTGVDRFGFELWEIVQLFNCSIVQLLLPWFVVAIPHRYFSIVLVSDQVSLRFEWFATQSCWSSWLIFGHFSLDFRSNLAVFWSCSNPLRSGGLFRSISAPCSIQNGIIDGRYNWFQQSWGHETTTDAS